MNGRNRRGPLRVSVIGLTGSGKSTCASFIEEFARDNGLSHARVKLARPLYELQEHVYRKAGIPLAENAQDQVLMEAIADMLRREHPHFLAESFVRGLPGPEVDLVVNDDLRDPGVDAAALRRQGFRIIRVTCGEEERRRRLAGRGDRSLSDRSTSRIDEIEPDHLIDNGADLGKYRAAVHEVLRSWL